MCSTRQFYGQKSGERLTWLNLSVVDICFAGKLSGWREEDGVIQSAQEFFLFIYLFFLSLVLKKNPTVLTCLEK